MVSVSQDKNVLGLELTSPWLSAKLREEQRRDEAHWDENSSPLSSNLSPPPRITLIDNTASVRQRGKERWTLKR